ncbi:DUF2958 domain-containing protein [Candidatus Beckwithbacteria bacterium]|nr:DUF2958 domain-containing protein [Candidatus Beckwithbacteria bacterium]
MLLIPDSLVKTIPTLYGTEYSKDPLVRCKFFLPGTGWTWYVTEFDGNDMFFGYVVGDFPELGYFSLKELENVRGPLGLRVERDLYFRPQPLSRIKSGQR